MSNFKNILIKGTKNYTQTIINNCNKSIYNNHDNKKLLPFNIYQLFKEYSKLNKVIKFINKNEILDCESYKIIKYNNFNNFYNQPISNKFLINKNKILLSNSFNNYQNLFSKENENILNSGFHIKVSEYYNEGSNNCIFTDNILWFGYTDLDVYVDKIIELKNFFNLDNYSLIPINLREKEFNHLNKCFLPIKKNQIMIYPNAFNKDALNIFYTLFDKENIICIEEEDAYNLCCNSIIIKNNIIITNKISKSLYYKLKYDYGLNIYKINFEMHNKLYKNSIKNFIVY